MRVKNGVPSFEVGEKASSSVTTSMKRVALFTTEKLPKMQTPRKMMEWLAGMRGSGVPCIEMGDGCMALSRSDSSVVLELPSGIFSIVTLFSWGKFSKK